MTELLHNPKIKPEHLVRKAIVYLRQSSEKQVRQNKESQRLQYAMAERVRALGWQEVEIINNDLGSSAGLAAAQREGFERVLSSVALGEAPGQAHRRDKLASMLWSDRSEDAARQNLRQCLSALRKASETGRVSPKVTCWPAL